MKKYLFLVIAFLFSLNFVSAGENIIENGDFQIHKKGIPEGWKLPKGFSLVKDGKKAWLKLEGSGQLSKWIKVDPSWKSVKFSARIKGTDVVAGEKGWQTGCVAFDCRDDRTQHIGSWAKIPTVTGTADWAECSFEYKIPEGAKLIKIDLANFGKSGTVEFDDISLIPVK